MSDQWFYAIGGQQQGPISIEQLQQLIQSGHVTPASLAWKEGMAQWTAIGQIPELTSQTSAAVTGAPGAINYQTNLSYFTPGRAAVTYAGFWIRVGAYIIDYIICYIPAFIINMLMGFSMAIMSRTAPGPRGAPNPAVFFAAIGGGLTSIVIMWLYFALMESSKYQATVGKMALGVIVTDPAGGRIGFGRATGRFFAKILSFMLCYIGVIMVGISDTKQGLHDMMAGTFVVMKNLPTT